MKVHTMKQILVSIITIICLSSGSVALASGYRHGGYHDGHARFAAGYYRHDGFGHRGYGKHHYRHHGYRHRRHHADEGAYLLGGLLIGAILTESYHRAQYNRAYPPERQIIYRTRVIERTAAAVAPGRHLFRDIDGNCFAIRRNDNGDELRSELPVEECDW